MSLPVSYWVNGLLFNMIVIPLTTGIAWSLGERFFHPVGYLGLAVAVLVFLIASTAWQVVGTWRSAAAHPGRGGSRFWASAARLSVAAGAVVFVYQLVVSAAPQFAELTRMALGDDELEPFEVSLENGGAAVELRGGFKHGVVDELRAVLDQHPSINVVVLNSLGGRTAEARAVASLIRERGLATRTTEVCYSACTIAFAGGRRRTMDPDAEIGFHSPSFPGLEQIDLRRETMTEQRAMQEAGIDPAFLAKAWSIPSEDLWIPTTQELLAARVITQTPGAVDVGDRFASREFAVRLLLSEPRLQSLRDDDVVRFNEIAESTQKRLRDGESQDEVLAQARKVVAGKPF